jgi:hypothetical protein
MQTDASFKQVRFSSTYLAPCTSLISHGTDFQLPMAEMLSGAAVRPSRIGPYSPGFFPLLFYLLDVAKCAVTCVATLYFSNYWLL